MFNGNLYPKSYVDWVQCMEGIFELKEYNNEKTFEMVMRVNDESLNARDQEQTRKNPNKWMPLFGFNPKQSK